MINIKHKVTKEFCLDTAARLSKSFTLLQHSESCNLINDAEWSERGLAKTVSTSIRWLFPETQNIYIHLKWQSLNYTERRGNETNKKIKYIRSVIVLQK